MEVANSTNEVGEHGLCELGVFGGVEGGLELECGIEADGECLFEFGDFLGEELGWSRWVVSCMLHGEG